MDIVEFSRFVETRRDRFVGVRPESSESLDAAESDLGHKLPSTMRWLLGTYGYSGPCGVDSLSEAVSTTLRCRSSMNLPSHYFILNDWGDAGVVFIDLRVGAIYWGDASTLENISASPPSDVDVFADYPAWVVGRLEYDEDLARLSKSTTEFPPELEAIHTGLSEREGVTQFFWPAEQVVYDACGAIGFIEGEGLYGFWASEGISHRRVVHAFRRVGAREVAEMISASSPLRHLIRSGELEYETLDSHLQWRDEFEPLESRLMDALKSVPPMILEFAIHCRVDGRSPSVITRVIGYVFAPFRFLGWFWQGARDTSR